jgi:hypothetical protein
VPNAVACGAEVARSSEGRAECAVTAA